MADWSEVDNQQHEGPGPDRAGARKVVNRVLLAALVALAGLAVAAPAARHGGAVAEPVCAAPTAAGTGIALPPGHPPLDGLRPRGRALYALPPGHPPIDQLDPRHPMMARPLNPVFEAPGIVDL